VTVLARFNYRVEPTIGPAVSPEAYARQAVRAALNGGPAPAAPPPNVFQVRVDDGPLKGRTLFVLEDHVARLIDPTWPNRFWLGEPGVSKWREFPNGAMAAMRSMKGTPKLRAGRISVQARKADNAGNVALAVAGYYALAREFPGLREGNAAPAVARGRGVARAP
jgi:hypothetical protein